MLQLAFCRCDFHMSHLVALDPASGYLTQEEVGIRIESLRAERGISQRRVAEAIGVDASAMSRIESGQRGLAVGEFVAISEFLGVRQTPCSVDKASPSQSSATRAVKVRLLMRSKPSTR